MSLADYIEIKPVITTKRLTLRAMTKDDVKDLEEWTKEKSLYQFWGKSAGRTDLTPALMFDKKEKSTKSFHFGIVENETSKVIGEFWVYLIENDRMAKIAFRISPKAQGKAYATEAVKAVVEFCFSKTQLLRLWTDVDVRNVASIKTLEKSGFLREGHIRQGKMVSTYCDYYLYGILKSDLIS